MKGGISARVKNLLRRLVSLWEQVLRGRKELPAKYSATLIIGAMLCLLSFVALIAIVSDTVTPHSQKAETASQAVDPFLAQTGDSLVNLHQSLDGGWAFQSQIQSPHFQTDRDVGAASVGMGFLVLADRYPSNPQWLQAAEQTAQWLSAAESKGTLESGSWPDYVDGNDRSDSTYTSFDDGALGIGDFYWRLYEKTGNTAYRDSAVESVRWTLAEAENVGTTADPAYRWVWDVNTRVNPTNGDNPPVYYMGMGEGTVGIINTLTTYYQRTKNSDPVIAAECKQYIDGGLRYIQQVQTTLGQNGGDSQVIPETGVVGQDGDTAMNAGYLSGAAGEAFMYLNLYKTFGDKSYLTSAQNVFNWLQNTKNGPMVTFSDGSIAWHIAVDPDGSGDPADSQLATGFEEGSAGIGWTYLQAYKVTNDTQYLTMSEKAANWLVAIANKNNGSYSWPEDESPTSPYVRPNLDNGAAGIGMFLYDEYLVSKNQSYLTAAKGAKQSLVSSAVHDGNNIYWKDNDEGSPFSNDPSWHWGDAGIIEFLSRLSGGSDDIPGEQSGL